MTTVNNEIKLKRLVSQILNIEETDIDDETSMANTLSWDSLKHMELIVAIEEDFKISRLTVVEIVSMTKINVIKEVLKVKGITF
ncbi:MAG: hypothetical protein A2X64_06515 [Ignavibacteria bacterium GWF2_33_9]|nr:MAG: hypothetical protein A2X64_06515 [Ignavibacteria bacterium GWF2_33_9]